MTWMPVAGDGLVGVAVFAASMAAVVVPAAAQNNGLPTQRQSAILMEVIADGGLRCGLLRPWQAASLRMQIRDSIARFDEAERAAIAAEADARRQQTGCDDPLLNAWIEGARPNFEREHLPEFLSGYRALALQDAAPAPFQKATGRTDYAAAVSAIEAKLAALEAAGVQPPGRMSWAALAERQSGFAAQIALAISGVGDAGRLSAAQAAQIAEDVGRIGELWLADQ